MNDHDRQRIATAIGSFVEGCGFGRPFHLIAIDARGSVSVTCYGSRGGSEQICSGPWRSTRFKLILPVTLTCISAEGCGRSIKIAVEPVRVTMQ
jgi:hypothetical protein